MDKQSELKQAYLEGFAAKCAEAGLDPEKVATMAGDFGRSLLPSAVAATHPVLGFTNTAANSIAPIAALLSGDVDEQEKKKLTRGRNAFLPGGFGYNIGRRARGVAGESKEDGARASKPNLWSEESGSLTAAGITTGLASLIGKKLGGRDGAARGALAGIGVSTAGTVAAALLALAKKRRTREEQTAHDDKGSNVLLNLLVPGTATYNRFKRIGRSRDWDADAKARKKQLKETN